MPDYVTDLLMPVAVITMSVTSRQS